MNEVVDGVSYSGQRYEFMIFAQRAGALTVPATAIDVAITKWGPGAGTIVHPMTLPKLEFLARAPPGAPDTRGLISTTDLTASQRWNPETHSVSVGDAITRTISFRAADLSAMAFPPLSFGRIATVSSYPGEASVDDRFNRGELTGIRVETVTYVFEGPGEIEIPGVAVSWWDVREQVMRHLNLSGLSVHVVARPIDDTAGVRQGEVQSTKRLWGILLLVSAIVIGFRISRLVLRHIEAFRQKRREAEAAYFARLMRSARAADKKAVLRDTMRWLDRIQRESRPARLDRFLDQYGDPDVRVAAADLTRTLSIHQDTTIVPRFAYGLRKARKRWLKAQHTRRQVAMVLPELN
jgi:hypothetical protein